MLRILWKSTCFLKCKVYTYQYVPLEMYTKLVTPALVSVQKLNKLLSDFGFNHGQISRIFNSPHAVKSLNQAELLSNLTNWLSFDMRDKVLSALSAYPELLTLNPEFVNFRVKELMTLFAKKDINKLLVTCPSVFLDEFTEIHDKVQYIVHTMDVPQKSIVKCRALQFNLHHIKCRHNFITYAGLYVVKKRSERSRNPPINKIFSRNLETFLKLTNLTEEEYLVFCTYFEDIMDLEERILNEEISIDEMSDYETDYETSDDEDEM